MHHRRLKTKYYSLKVRVFEILEKAQKGDVVSKIFDVGIILLILLSIVMLLLETEPSLANYYSLFAKINEVIVILFTVEYVLRIWTCNLMKEYKKPFVGIIKYIFSPMAMVDLLAILPFYIPMIIPYDLRFLRILRLFRFFRLLKLNRYSQAMKTIGRVVQEKKEDLIISFSVLILLLIFASCIMYYAENPYQPEVYSSILSSMWWGVSTLTTVGYGDIYPITALGKLISSSIAILGIGIVGLPTGILASGFIEEVQKKKKPCDLMLLFVLL